MENITLIYGTITGNTERLARVVRDVLSQNQLSVDLINVKDANVKHLLDSGIFILGCSTWEGGQLQEDFIPFEKKIRKLDLSEKRAAIFGSGDSIFREFGRAVDKLEKTLLHCHAILLIDSLKLDESKGDPAPAVRNWAVKLAKSINEADILASRKKVA
jgi:flavodoxin I